MKKTYKNIADFIGDYSWRPEMLKGFTITSSNQYGVSLNNPSVYAGDVFIQDAKVSDVKSLILGEKQNNASNIFNNEPDNMAMKNDEVYFFEEGMQPGYAKDSLGQIHFGIYFTFSQFIGNITKPITNYRFVRESTNAEGTSYIVVSDGIVESTIFYATKREFTDACAVSQKFKTNLTSLTQPKHFINNVSDEPKSLDFNSLLDFCNTYTSDNIKGFKYKGISRIDGAILIENDSLGVRARIHNSFESVVKDLIEGRKTKEQASLIEYYDSLSNFINTHTHEQIESYKAYGEMPEGVFIANSKNVIVIKNTTIDEYNHAKEISNEIANIETKVEATYEKVNKPENIYESLNEFLVKNANNLDKFVSITPFQEWTSNSGSHNINVHDTEFKSYVIMHTFAAEYNAAIAKAKCNNAVVYDPRKDGAEQIGYLANTLEQPEVKEEKVEEKVNKVKKPNIIKNKFIVGHTYSLNYKVKGSKDKSFTKTYICKQKMHKIENRQVDIVIMKQIAGPESKQFCLNQHDCKVYHIKYETGLEVYSMNLNWKEVKSKKE